MKAKHTPGPWNASLQDEAVFSESGDCIASTHWMKAHVSPATNDANARLIAASPDLLEFAQWAMNQFCGDSGTGETHWEQFPEFVAGQAAIAKATGEQ